MWSLLSIVIGIVFVMLLFSLLATSIMELLAGLLALRGKHLVKAIGAMIGDLQGAFVHHPYFQQLSIGSRMSKHSLPLPSFVSPGTFSAILSDLVNDNNGHTLGERIHAMPDGNAKEVITFLYKQTGDDVEAFRLKLEEWYNEIMDRASGAYIRKTRNYLVVIGFALAVVFNVDPIQIYHNLSVNAALRDFVADMATEYVSTREAPAAASLPADSSTYYQARERIGELVNDNISILITPLGLGWEDVKESDMNSRWWLYKLIGWLTTAIAVSLGANFWFNLLRQLVSLRSTAPPSTPTASVGTNPAPGSGSFLTKPGPDSPLESTRRKKTEPPADKDKQY